MMEINEVLHPETSSFIVGVVSDSHVPDRVNALHPSLLKSLREHQAQMIWHVGDVSMNSVLMELETVAPVRAVMGNRDILLRRHWPRTYHFDIYGMRVTLTHGHMGPRVYWLDKLANYTRGYDFERYRRRFEFFYPESKVLVFGHTHHTENCWVGGRLFFNPGSISRGDKQFPQPSWGILKFYEDGRIESSLIPLTGAAIRMMKWEIEK